MAKKIMPVCPICQQARPDKILSGLFDDRFGVPGTYDIVQCSYCGMEQIWPQPTQVELKELYEQFYNWGGEKETFYTKVREWLLASPFYRLWLKWDGDFSFHLRQGSGRLLDIGCNEGRGLAIYAKNGFQAEGLELNENAAAAARAKGFQVYTESLERFVPEEPFDVVVLANVIEHLPDPLATLKEVRRILSPGGRVWISCPNSNSLWRRVFGRHWVQWHVPFHLWHFSPRTLKEILARANFHPVEMQTFTPSLWLAASICALFSQRGRANRWMRSAPVMAGLMLISFGLLLPLSGGINGRLAGDCLVVGARLETGMQ